MLLAWSPLDLRGMGYSEEEVAAAFRLLSWTMGDPQPAEAPPLLSPQGIVTRHGILEPLVKLPFAAAGRLLAPLFPNSPRFAERFLSVLPVLQIALLAALLFLWTERLTGSSRWGVAIALGGTFGTMLWPYAYLGLETTQATALVIAAYLAFTSSPPTPQGNAAGRASHSLRGLGFLLAAAIALAAKSTSIVLLPAVAFLVWIHFRRRDPSGALLRPLVASLLGLAFLLGVVYANWFLRGYFTTPAEEAHVLREFFTTDPMRLVSSVLMLLFSGNKGLIVYAPLAILGLACVSAAWRRHRELALFASLVLASMVGAFSVVGVPAEETWGPRYILAAVPPLTLCVAAAWGRGRLAKHRRWLLAAVLLAGFVVSALGSLFYYGRVYLVAKRVDQATLEALWGDPVWNPVAMNLRLARLWLAPSGVSSRWTPKHRWWFERPAGVPPDPTVDLAHAATPQPLLLRSSQAAPLDAPREILAAALTLGLGTLALAWRGAATRGDRRVRRSGPLLSAIARRRKIAHFLDPIPSAAAILEIGSGSGWVGDYLRANGWTNYVGLDLEEPADVVGDIRNWRALGLAPESFDVIIAFEVVEHVDCFAECYELLKPGGRLLLTSPVPHMDWVMKLLEAVRLNQRRTSPHDHLVYFANVPWSGAREIRTVGMLSQWGTFTKAS